MLFRSFEDSIKDINRAIELCSETNLSKYHYHRAKAYLELKDYESALNDCNKSMQLMPNNKKCYQLRMEIYEAKGEKEKAEQDRRISDLMDD